MACETYPSGVTICRPGETREVVRKPDGDDRWCFVCRHRRAFWYVVTDEVQPSYYGPWPAVKCSEGHTDGDLFPGRTREWEDA